MISETDLKDIFRATTEKLINEIYKDYGIQKNITKQTLTEYVDNYPINIKFMVKDKPIITNKTIKEDERCQARTWNNGYINADQDEIIYGGLCNKKIIPNSLYCSSHDADLVHGNYYMPPSPLVKGFFHKVNITKLHNHHS